MSELSVINETRGVLAIYRLAKMTMQKSVFDIQLMHGPRLRSGKAKDHIDGGWLDHGTESFAIVHPFPLSGAAKNPTCLILGKRSIWV